MPQKEMSLWKAFICSSALIVTLIFVSGLVIEGVFGAWKSGGEFGDSFGVLNVLFSGLALAGIVCTLLLQSKELRLQRLELRQQRKELSRQAALLTINIWLQSRIEARATFRNSGASPQSKDRILRLNRVASRMTDVFMGRIMEELDADAADDRQPNTPIGDFANP